MERLINSLLNKTCVIGICALAATVALLLWVYSARIYGDAIFLNLCSAAILTLLLRCFLQKRPPNKKEWWFLKGSLFLSAVFWFQCGSPVENSFFIEYLFGFLIFQWFLYIACIAMAIVLDEKSLGLRQSVQWRLPLFLAIFIALLKIQLLELDSFHQIFYASWYDLVFSVQGAMTMALALGCSVLLMWLIFIVSSRKMSALEGVLMLSLLFILCSQVHPRYLLFPLCALPGFYTCFYLFLKRKEIIYGIGAFLCMLIGLVVGDGWILIPIGLHLLMNGIVLFLNRVNHSEIHSRRRRLVYSSLFASSMLILLWLGILVTKGAKDAKGIDLYETEVEIQSEKGERVQFNALSDLHFKLKCQINCSYVKQGEFEMGNNHYQNIRIGLVDSKQQEELLKHKNKPFSISVPDYYQKWSRDFLHFKDLSFGVFRRVCPPQFSPNKKSIVNISEHIWLDTASGVVYEISSIENE